MENAKLNTAAQKEREEDSVDLRYIVDVIWDLK